MKKLLACMLSLSLLYPAMATAESSGAVPSCTSVITENPEWHCISLEPSPEEFDRLGFQYGDSCDLVFSNGNVLKGIPYYNGYYGRLNDPMLVSYPGNQHVLFALNCGAPAWDFYGCREGDTVTVTVAEPGKYLSIQNALDTVYSNNRADYPDDAVFANFRALSGGRLKKDTFYRGASPVNDTYNRAVCADGLIRDTGIRFVLDLADTREILSGFEEETRPEYYLSLDARGLVLPIGLSASFISEDYQQSLAAGLREMMKHEGPYYIHCMEGKDRTGFVCMLLEALAGATGEELEADYMLTYRNYYGILPGSEQYGPIHEYKYLDLYHYLADLGSGDTEAGARTYLYQAGMTPDEVDGLQSFLTQN